MGDHGFRSTVRVFAHGFPEPFGFPVLDELPQEHHFELKTLGFEDCKDKLGTKDM